MPGSGYNAGGIWYPFIKGAVPSNPTSNSLRLYAKSAADGLFIRDSAGGESQLYNTTVGLISAINVSAGATSNNMSAITFSNGSGVSFGLAGSVITATVQTNYLTTAMASNRGSDFVQATAAFAGTSASGTIASNGISVSIGPYITTAALSNHSHGNPQLNLTNLSGTTASNSAGFTLSLSGPASGLTSQSNQNVTAANGGFAFQTLSFSNTQGVSFATSAGSAIVASVETSYAASNHSHGNPTLALTNLTGTTASASNGFTLSLSAAAPGAGGAVSFSAGTSSAALASIVFSNSNGVSFGLSGSTMTASVNAAGGGSTYSSTVFGKQLEWAQLSATLGQNTVYIFPEIVHEAVSGSIIKIPVMVTHSSSAAASVQRGLTVDFGVYTRNATNSTVLTRHYSTSYTLSASHSSNASWRIAVITAVGNSTSYNSVTASSAGLNLSASIHGAREFIMPWATVLAPGEYWFAIRNSSSSAGASGAILNLSYIIGSSSTQNRLGVSINATNDGIARNIGYGSYSATSGALPAGISMTQINASAIAPVIFFLAATV